MVITTKSSISVKPRCTLTRRADANVALIASSWQPIDCKSRELKRKEALFHIDSSYRFAESLSSIS
jgi:hypothetical protein